MSEVKLLTLLAFLFFGIYFKLIMFVIKQKLYYLSVFYPLCCLTIFFVIPYCEDYLLFPRPLIIAVYVIIISFYIFLTFYCRKKAFDFHEKRKWKKFNKQRKEILEQLKKERENNNIEQPY